MPHSDDSWDCTDRYQVRFSDSSSDCAENERETDSCEYVVVILHRKTPCLYMVSAEIYRLRHFVQVLNLLAEFSTCFRLNL